MKAAQLYARHPGIKERRYTQTDIAHAIRACSRGALGDTFWSQVCSELAEREGNQERYSVGCVFEALAQLVAKKWLTFHEDALLGELECSQRAGGIAWELVPVGHQQLYWRVVADEQALAATQAETVKLVLEPSDRELLAAAARLPL
jgi:hypothetical protein